MRRVLIVGATSAIAEATARIFAQRGDALYLVARNAQQLESIARDLQVRGASAVGLEVMDANEFAAHEPMFVRAEQTLGAIDTVLIAHGTLSNQPTCQADVGLTLQEIRTNALSVVALLTLIAQRFESRRSGTIAALSSVAGDRGRESNYVYGSSKALLSAFLSGLRQRLAKAGVNVITIKPGFVDTPMTAALPKKGLLWAKPQQVAAGIIRAIDRSAPVVYLPWFWRIIMLIIRSIPERIFMKLRI